MLPGESIRALVDALCRDGMGKISRRNTPRITNQTSSKTTIVGMGVINDFLSRYRHLLVPFDDMPSLHPPLFKRNDSSTFTHTVCHNMNATRSLWNLTYVPNAPTRFTERVPTKTVCLIYIKLFGFQFVL